MKIRPILSLVAAIALTAVFPSSNAGAAGQTCGGFIGIACSDKGEFCQNPPDKFCISDAQGKCQKIPAACAQVMKPVCGCDGKPYNNDCERQAAKVSKRNDGRCKS